MNNSKICVTPETIEKLRPNEIFVFGSNEAGYHGAGAALTAAINFGAQFGIGVGLVGQSYALPTKDVHIHTLPLLCIQEYVNGLHGCVLEHPELIFYVTKVGCGLAGLTVNVIAPLFNNMMLDTDIHNVYYPIEFYQVNQIPF